MKLTPAEEKREQEVYEWWCGYWDEGIDDLIENQWGLKEHNEENLEIELQQGE